MANPMMEIDQGTPNGFHDCSVFGYAVDFTARRMLIDLGIDMSLSGERRRLRRCRVTIDEIAFVAVEAGDGVAMLTRPQHGASSDGGVLEGERLRQIWPTELPTGVFAYWLFLNEMNAFIYISGRGGRLEWVEA